MTDKLKSELLNGLANVAVKHPNEIKASRTKRKRRSRFFTPLNSSIQDNIEEKKRLIEEKARELEDPLLLQIKAITTRYGQTLPESIGGNVDLVRTFILEEIQPLIIAANAGTIQAQEILGNLQLPLDSTVTSKISVMLRRAIALRIATFIAEFTKIPKNQIRSILYETPKPKANQAERKERSREPVPTTTQQPRRNGSRRVRTPGTKS